MSSKRLYFVLLGLIGLLLVGLLVGTYGANKLLESHAATLTDYKAQNQALADEQTVLIRDKKDIQKYADLEQIAKVVVPEDKNQAEAVQEIVNIAGANSITLGSITFPPSTLGNIGNSGTSSAPASSSATGPLAAAGNPSSNANKLSQLVAVPGIPGVYQLTLTVSTDPKYPVKYSQLIGFLEGLERDRRTAQVNSISLSPSQDNPSYLDSTIVLNEYIKP